MVTYFLFLALLVGCCGYALVQGGAPEKAGAGLQLLAFTIDDANHRMVDGLGYVTVAIGSWSIDIALLIALTVLACRSTRFWPIWIAGWQMAAIVGHAAKFLDPSMQPFSYAVEAQIWAYPMLLATAIGALRHRRRLAAGDPDPPWKMPGSEPVMRSEDAIRHGPRGAAA